MHKKRFILGVGAQKCGTSWLYSYLSKSPRAAPGLVKEYHVWDGLLVSACQTFLVTEAERAQSDVHDLRWQMQRDPERYFAHFAEQLEAPDKDVSFDLTPSYSTLPALGYRTIDEGFAARGIDVRAVFLMRDPVERCHSQARMVWKYETLDPLTYDDRVVAFALSQKAEIRTRYDLTRKALGEGFAAGQVYTGLYEEMHSAPHLDALSTFCGVAFDPEFANERIHTNPVTIPLGEAARARIARHFRVVYSDVATVFPQAVDLWPGYRYL